MATSILTDNGDPVRLDRERLDLDRYKVEEELRLRAEELRLLRDQFEAGKGEDKDHKGNWYWPLVTTIIVTLLTAIGAIIGNLVQGSNTYRLEEKKATEEQRLQQQKQKGDLILHAIRTERSEDARENLIFLADSGLIELPPEQLEKLKNNEGVVPLLPPVVFGESTVRATPPAVASKAPPVPNQTTPTASKPTPAARPRNEPGNQSPISGTEQGVPAESRSLNSFSVLDERELRLIMPSLSPEKVRLYLPHLHKAMTEFGITTRLRQAAFLANIAWRSNELGFWEEPGDGNSRYEGNARLGNTQLGDGRKYKARGPFSIVGRRNYELFGGKLGVDLVNNPDLAATPEVGFRVAAILWQTQNWNKLADEGRIQHIGRQINGGLTGMNERVAYFNLAKAVLSVNDAEPGTSK